MRKNKLVISVVVFFLLINTRYFWQFQLGPLIIPAFLLFCTTCMVLALVFVWQIYLMVKERFANRHRWVGVIILTVILSLIAYKPEGLIDFERFERKDVLVAVQNSAGNQLTTLRLKEDFTFIEQFTGMAYTEVKGNYHYQHDTIYFDNVRLGPYVNRFYQFAVIKPSKLSWIGQPFDLMKYENIKDTVGEELWLIKNETNKIKPVTQ